MSPVVFLTRVLIPLLRLLLNPLPKALLADLPTMGARIVTSILGRYKGFSVAEWVLGPGPLPAVLMEVYLCSEDS